MRWFAALLVWLTAVPAQDKIRIGAKNFTESAILAELMAQTIEAQTDLEVELRTGLGGTMICWAAVLAGEVDIYAEYSGTGWATILGQADKVTDPLRAFYEVQRRCRDEHDVHWLAPFGFNNTYALAMREDLADELGVTRISDLVRHQHTVRAGFGIEFGSRNDGYPGLAATYGLELANVRTVEHALAYEAIQSGAIDLMDAYSTDGKLLRFKVRVLEDDRRFFPPYNAAPIVRGETLRKHPELHDALARLAYRLTDLDAQALNYIVEADGVAPRDAARAFLELEGIVSDELASAAKARIALVAVRKAPPKPGRVAGDRPGFLELSQAKWPTVVKLLGQHVWMVLIAVFWATLISVPLGIAITTRRRLRQALIGSAGILQTIPSLALLALMIPLLGMTREAAIVALILYAILPILRNTYTGISEVDPDLIDAARGMGMRPREMLLRVQLPLALPTIMAGVRTAAVISVGVATLAAFIGAGGLGQLVLEGLYLNYGAMIWLGAIPAAMLAIVTDQLLGLIQSKLVVEGS